MREPDRPADLLGGILREVRSKTARSEVSEALDDVLGEATAEHCRVTGMRAGRLTVEVDSAPLFAELRGFRSEEIRDAMNARIARDKVTEIVFRLGAGRNG